MGKTKANKRRNRPEAPTGLPSEKEIAKEEEEMGAGEDDAASASDAALQTITEQLQGSVEDKVFALHSLASLFQTPACLKDVVQQKVVRIAAPLLLDPSSAVRNAAAGALRNLTSSGNHEICDLLVEQDIMTPLTALLHKFASEWQITDKSDTENTDTFAQVVNLLWNLCEGNSRAVQYFNEGNLLPVLIKYLRAGFSNVNVSIAIVQCLLTVVEDNPQACRSLHEAESVLQGLMGQEGGSPDFLFLRVLVAGVLLKLGNRPQDMLTPVLVSAIVTPLKQDQREALHRLTSIDPEKLADDTSALQEASWLLEAQQTALELLVNLCADDDDDDDYMDVDSTSTSSDDGMGDVSFPDGDISDLDASTFSLSPEIHEVIVSQQLPVKIWEKTLLPAENVYNLLHEHSGGQQLLKRLDVLRCRAYLCLNNLIPALDVQDFGGPQWLLDMFTNIATQVFKEAKEGQDPSISEAASAAMRAALQKVAQCGRDPTVTIQPKNIEFVLKAVEYSDPNVRANMVRTACILGTIAMPYSTENSFNLLKSIGKFLLDMSAHETEVWVQAEALDSIIDIFGEDETDQAAAELGLVDRLQALMPGLRRKVHSSKKKLGEHRALVSTVIANLPRFIQYKAKRLKEQ